MLVRLFAWHNFFVVLKVSSNCLRGANCPGAGRITTVDTVASSLLIGLKSEIAVSGHANNEGSCTSGLISCRHNNVAVGSPVEQHNFGDLIPRHKLYIFLILYVVLGGVLSTWIYVEADHAADKVGTDRFLPGLLRPA